MRAAVIVLAVGLATALPAKSQEPLTPVHVSGGDETTLGADIATSIRNRVRSTPTLRHSGAEDSALLALRLQTVDPLAQHPDPGRRGNLAAISAVFIMPAKTVGAPFHYFVHSMVMFCGRDKADKCAADLFDDLARLAEVSKQ